MIISFVIAVNILVVHIIFIQRNIICEVCQLFTDFCPYVFEKKVASDVRYLLKVAEDIFKRNRLIIENIAEKERSLFEFTYQYTFFMGSLIENTVTLHDLIDPYELFK